MSVHDPQRKEYCKYVNMEKWKVPRDPKFLLFWMVFLFSETADMCIPNSLIILFRF
jgi:hypothetical protein